MTPIFHITTAADWEAARAAGSHTGSTRGQSLAEVGFIHCSRGDQWPRIRDLVYADVTEPLVLLKIDPDRLDVPVVEESTDPASSETFPHIYGPLPVDAVSQVIPLDRSRVSTSSTTEPSSTSTRPAISEDQFGPIFLREMFRNVVVLIVLCANVMGGAIIGHAIRDDGYGALGGLAIGALVGVPLAILVKRQVSTDE